LPQPEAGEPGAANLRELIVQNLLIYHDQAAALINRRGEILHIHGRTGKYLEPASGYATLNILSMARKGLGRALAAALHGVVSRKEPVHHQGLRIRTNGEAITASLSLRPAQRLKGELLTDIFLLVLEETPIGRSLPDEGTTPADAGDTEVDNRIAALELELRNKEEYLQTTLEEMETSNEELKSTNEEMQSVNEELQSTNEELETSKEELQSVNE